MGKHEADAVVYGGIALEPDSQAKAQAKAQAEKRTMDPWSLKWANLEKYFNWVERHDVWPVPWDLDLRYVGSGEQAKPALQAAASHQITIAEPGPLDDLARFHAMVLHAALTGNRDCSYLLSRIRALMLLRKYHASKAVPQ